MRKFLILVAIVLSLIVLKKVVHNTSFKNIRTFITNGNENIPVILKWCIETESGLYGYSAPEVVGDVIYLGNQENCVNAIEKETSKLIWQFHDKRTLFSSPSVVDGVVYVGGWNRDPTSYDCLYAIDAKNGKLKWRLKTRDPGVGTSSPVVVDGIVYVVTSNEMIYAVDAYSGELNWSFETGKDITSNLSIANDTVCFGSLDKYLYAVDAKSGDLKWRYKTDDIILSTSIIEKIVFIGTWENTPTENSLSSYKSQILYAIDTESGELKWKQEMKWTSAFFPVVVDDIVYIGTVDNYLYALDINSGEVNWRFKTGGPIRSSASVVDSVIYIGSDDYYLYAIDSISHDLIWKYKVKGPIDSTTVVGDVIYFRTGRVFFTKSIYKGPYLYALEIKRQ